MGGHRGSELCSHLYPISSGGQGQPLLIAWIGTDSKPQNDSHIPRPHDTSGQPCWAVDQSQGTSTSIPLASHSLEPHLQIVRACWAVSQHVETQAEFGGALRSDLPRDVLPPCSSAAATQGRLSQGHCPGKGRASSGRWEVMFPACFFQMETLLRGLVAGQ